MKYCYSFRYKAAVMKNGHVRLEGRSGLIVSYC